MKVNVTVQLDFDDFKLAYLLYRGLDLRLNESPHDWTQERVIILATLELMSSGYNKKHADEDLSKVHDNKHFDILLQRIRGLFPELKPEISSPEMSKKLLRTETVEEEYNSAKTVAYVEKPTVRLQPGHAEALAMASEGINEQS